ncbi:hypothetical protein DAEQUDRAFT_394683 [Daedalea quercina L-15889]|uniref:Reverse transcriptase zinc-binding domain-containing protein n=1 Tax=Daedalea quercina L-15889 TaxID=1314783 RepID=A0A165NX67_9APHY|nr:hypothetical protein DAEQUDRAFT_394683 [Daedalea quercina L-15889]
MSYVADLPPWAALTLYLSHVDAHLISGCEVTIDIRKDALVGLASVQHSFLRRTLGLSSRSLTTVLFTETGLWPIHYRRLSLALHFLLYVVTQRPQLPLAAVAESRWLALNGSASWLGDIHFALQQLPAPVMLPLLRPLTQDVITLCMQHLVDSMRSSLAQDVLASQRLVVLQARPPGRGVLARREYLGINCAPHRRAVCRLLASEHPFAVERLRRRTQPTPRNWRICRFCRTQDAIENEEHVLMLCPAEPLRRIREPFMRDVHQILRSHKRAVGISSPLLFLIEMLGHDCTLGRTGQYVYDIFQCCDAIPLLVVTSMEQLLSYATQ